MQAHARSLALAQKVADKPTLGLQLARRLADNGAALPVAYRAIVEATREGREITLAAEWLIDDYQLVEKHLRQVSADLPPDYYRQLPTLISGPFAGYPRAFGIAWPISRADHRAFWAFFNPKMRWPFQFVPVMVLVTCERLLWVVPFQAKPLSRAITCCIWPFHSRTGSAPALRVAPSRVEGGGTGRRMRTGCCSQYAKRRFFDVRAAYPLESFGGRCVSNRHKHDRVGPHLNTQPYLAAPDFQ